ncbi:hypothetical protein D5018_09285 [Parashewanella curva]|uniref:Uncharacterized protein n=1 Tax=Parashewanella curva TaxID=2338552 RepID=A0A3L8PX11_9GAMM|nr:hypothetical protein [Parashewanella curva]RLV59987.1 hypothetical protein D5018_09285 [Parashewanella curva]
MATQFSPNTPNFTAIVEQCPELSELAKKERHNAVVTGVFDSHVEFEHSDATSCTFRYHVSSKQLCMNGYNESNLKLSEFHTYSSAIEMNVDRQRVRFFLHRNKTTPLVLLCDAGSHYIDDSNLCLSDSFDSNRLDTFHSPVHLTSSNTISEKKSWNRKVQCELTLIGNSDKELAHKGDITFVYCLNTYLWGGTSMDGIWFPDMSQHRSHSAGYRYEEKWFKEGYAKLQNQWLTADDEVYHDHRTQIKDFLTSHCSHCQIILKRYSALNQFHKELEDAYQRLSEQEEQDLVIRFKVNLRV